MTVLGAWLIDPLLTHPPTPPRFPQVFTRGLNTQPWYVRCLCWMDGWMDGGHRSSVGYARMTMTA